MKPILLISLVLISANVIFADSHEKWKNYMKVVEEEGMKELNEKRARLNEPRLTFTCSIPPRSDPKPTSVHQLRPGDIDVVGAVGDSLTAANGAAATNLVNVLVEYRGLAWSMGGDEDVSTFGSLPNILKKFNPNLYGFSVGASGSDNLERAGFNLAEPGHTSHDIYQQSVNMINRMKNDPKVNMDEDWKLVTVFIGGNDLCNACDDTNKYTANNYVNNVKSTLHYLKNNLKRTYVNLVLSLDVTAIDDLNGFICNTMQSNLCSCGLKQSSFRPELLKLTKAIQDDTVAMVEAEGFDDREDFAVVVQPFMTKMKAPELNGSGDKSYFAPDCFHFSKKGHSAAGVELWNNMLTPVGQKPNQWVNLGEVIMCPSETSPYLYTKNNS